MKKKHSFYLMIVVLVFFLSLASTGNAFEILIDVSPNVLNLQSMGELVTVHTNIGFGDVNVSSIYLNNVLIASWKADNQGYFVAKFKMEDIKNLPLIIGGYNTLMMVGVTKGGLAFSGQQDIKVINVIPTGKK